MTKDVSHSLLIFLETILDGIGVKDKCNTINFDSDWSFQMMLMDNEIYWQAGSVRQLML